MNFSLLIFVWQPSAEDASAATSAVTSAATSAVTSAATSATTSAATSATTSAAPRDRKILAVESFSSD